MRASDKWDVLMMDRMNRGYTYSSTTDKDKPLETQPHYSDSRFKKEQTVFGKAADSLYGHSHLSYDYSDRLWEWDYDKMKTAFEHAKAQSGIVPQSCRYYEVALSYYFGKPIVIEHIIAGVNHSNGYPYAVYGYRDK